MADDATDGWTVERAGTTYGPVSWEELTAWARDGQLGPTDVLRRAGDPTAHLAGDVPGLLPGRPTAAVPVAARVPWIPVLVVVSVATLGIVLGVRAIGSRDDATVATTVPTTAGGGTTTTTIEPGGPPVDASAYLGEWAGNFIVEPTGVGDDGNFWGYGFSNRIEFQVAEVEGGPTSPGEVRLWGEAVVPPATDYRPFDGSVARITGDGSLSFSVLMRHDTGESDWVVLHFTGGRSAHQIRGTLTGERLDTGGTVTGTWYVNQG